MNEEFAEAYWSSRSNTPTEDVAENNFSDKPSVSWALKEEPTIDGAAFKSSTTDPLQDEVDAQVSTSMLGCSNSPLHHFMSEVKKEELEDVNVSCEFSVNALVRAVLQKIHNRKCSNAIIVDTIKTQQDEDTDDGSSSKTVDKTERKKKRRCKSKLVAHRVKLKQHRARLAKETPEETEFRLMRQRMLTMKNRLILRLEEPEKLKAHNARWAKEKREKWKRTLAKETEEQAKERKKEQAEKARQKRQRALAIETPEQKIERQMKLRTLRSEESAEKRAIRLEKQRNCQMQQRHRNYEMSQTKGKVSVKTGKIYTTKGRKRKLPESKVLNIFDTSTMVMKRNASLESAATQPLIVESNNTTAV